MPNVDNYYVCHFRAACQGPLHPTNGPPVIEWSKNRGSLTGMILRAVAVLSLAGWLAQAHAAEVAVTTKLSPGLMQVVKLVQSGVAEEVVLSYIENSPVPRPHADDVIQLHGVGVPDRVLMALLSKKVTFSEPAAAGNMKNNGAEPARRFEAPASTPPPQTAVYVQRPPAVYIQPAPTVAYAPSYYSYPYYSYPYYSYPYYSYPYYHRYGYTWPAVSLAFGFGHFFGHHSFGHHFGGHHGGLHFARH